jgi:hypothetical protein
VPVESRWNREAILAITATPRAPNPGDPDDDNINPPAETAAREPAEPEEGVVQDDVLVQSEGAPRELKISKKALDKYGRTPGCGACTASLTGKVNRPHTAECRNRIYQQMSQDEEYRGALEKKMEKHFVYHAPRDEGADAHIPATVAQSEPSGSREEWCPPADEPAVAKPLSPEEVFARDFGPAPLQSQAELEAGGDDDNEIPIGEDHMFGPADGIAGFEEEESDDDENNDAMQAENLDKRFREPKVTAADQMSDTAASGSTQPQTKRPRVDHVAQLKQFIQRFDVKKVID